MRLFAALPIPEPIVARLTSLQLRIGAPRDGLRWSSPEQWHITLQFYGEVQEDDAACLGKGLFQLAQAPEVTIERLDLFSAKGILLAAVEASPALLDLQAEVVKRSGACGIRAESRPFRPHITLARSKGKTGYASLKRMSTPELPSLGTSMRWIADEVLLLESILRPQGAEYVVRARCQLPTNTLHEASLR